MSETTHPPEAPAHLAHLYTPEVRAILADLDAWMAADEEVRTQSTVAAALHYSSGTISKLCHRRYAGDVAGLCAKIERMIGRSRQRAHAPGRPPFRKTSVYERVADVCNRAHLAGGLAAVLGPTGVGKTMAVRHYQELEPGTIYVEAGPLCRAYALMRELGRQLRVPWPGSKYLMLQALAEALHGSDRLIIIDEADYLAEEALHVLRQITDRADVGIVLVGTESLLQKLRDLHSTTINQVLGRIGYTEHLGQIAHDDLETITQGADLAEGALDELVRQAHGQARRAVLALVTAQGTAGGKPVTRRHVRRAYRTLMPVLNGLPKGG